MVIVEKKAKSEEVWVNCNLSDVEVRRKPASTQHSIGRGGEVTRGDNTRKGRVKLI
jgi:hypothetical protein